MITLENIVKTYGSGERAVTALDGIDLHVAAGTISGVIGLSGAGKSTLIRCVNLLERPTSGRVEVDGVELTRLDTAGLRAARHQIGMIFQHFNLLDSRTVYANVALPLELMKMSKAEIRERVLPLLELTGLASMAERHPAQLSGGQKQRVAIARALASRPKVLLCDEATSALDPHTTTSILALLREINQKLGLTILLITHEMEVVKTICDQVSLIEGGKLVETAEVGRFFTAPASQAARAFINDYLELEIPPELLERMGERGDGRAHPVVRLTFGTESVDRPLISHLSRRFDIDISILQARVEAIQSHTLGLMIAELIGDPETTAEVIAYMQSIDLDVEVIGHVPGNE
ncbi:methionine ABC transporter ATP-binding protein [Halotalea alkalilenta]|uniref:Cell division ATP-binding protein FtsE n=1 Tax=Halotalea alkalilenta TaxID=376489 RepID=A0A172YEH9_9GAMM|nr:methionine ABC transporter ATP-binding protein [Halotalea alkalilenta]ANF57643.1 DL-methionine transporter ATP-binding subunit [Halotalea alkalilenta]